MQKNVDLKTVGDLQHEGRYKLDKLVSNLASETEVKNKNIEAPGCKYKDTSASIGKMMEQKEKLLHSYNERTGLKIQEA